MKPNYSAIVAHYENSRDSILASRKDQYGIDPYAWELVAQMTPIEKALWDDMRCIGMVMYPQYPVGRYFVDFGHPKAKVAIECDGAAYHQDWKADKKRQQEIEALGWKVYRFTGRQCKEEQPEPDDDDMGSAYRQLKMIAAFHGLSQGLRLTEEVMNDPYLLEALAQTSSLEVL